MTEPPENPIKSARKAAGFKSQGEAARAAGIDQATYNQYETGKVLPGRAQLRRIAKAFGCRVIDLLEPEDLVRLTCALPA